MGIRGSRLGPSWGWDWGQEQEQSHSWAMVGASSRAPGWGRGWKLELWLGVEKSWGQGGAG